MLFGVMRRGIPRPDEDIFRGTVKSSKKGKKPDFVIRGVIKDAKTGEPIEGAKVSDHEYGPEPRKGATANPDGRYEYVTCREEHNIVAKASGYRPQYKTLITKPFSKKKEEVMNFELVPEGD